MVSVLTCFIIFEIIESSEEAEQLREAVLSCHVRLKQAELEAERWKEELRRLQTHNCSQSQQIHQLRQDRQNSQEHSNRSENTNSINNKMVFRPNLSLLVCLSLLSRCDQRIRFCGCEQLFSLLEAFLIRDKLKAGCPISQSRF